MSNPESFIQEVSDEVRRDRLYGLYRRFGWIGLVLILGIVGGTAWVQYSKSRDSARAEGFGDALIEALDNGTPAERKAALEAVPADGSQLWLRELIAGSDPFEDKPGALAALDKVAADTTAPDLLRDLAVLRRVTIAGKDQPLAERRTALEALAQPGRPYRALAAEQLAYLLIEDGKTAEAITALNALTTAQDATGGLRGRAAQVVTALGGTPPEVISDAAPDAAVGAAETEE